MYKIKFASLRIKKQLDKLPFGVFKRIDKIITTLIQNPFPSGTVKLKGFENFYRVRIGDYRIIYNINHKAQEIILIRVAHRKDAYKI